HSRSLHSFPTRRSSDLNCVFKLDERTLANIHPIYQQRCEIDGLDYRYLGLAQEDIEPGNGMPVPIEQPTAIVPRPLSPDDQDDRSEEHTSELQSPCNLV